MRTGTQSTFIRSRSSSKEKNTNSKEELKSLLQFVKTETFTKTVQNKLICKQYIANRKYDKQDKDRCSVIRKLKKMKPQQRMKTLGISKAIMIEDLIMQQKTKSLSKYILKESFDFGEKKYFCKILNSIKYRLVQNRITLNDDKRLIQQQKQSAFRKYKMIKHHRLNNQLTQALNLSKKKDYSQTIINTSVNDRLNISYRKNHQQIQSKRSKHETNKIELSDINRYFTH